MLSELVAHHLARVPIADVMAHLARLTEHDRYQASLGIERAAEEIAAAAEAIGLADVTIARFEADGSTPWWTFQAPRAWTPVIARLRAGAIAVDHAHQPFTIATYSAPTPPGGLVARVATLHDDVAGAVVLLDDLARIPELVARGAAGFVTAATSRGSHVGRVELDSATPLFGFSVTPAQWTTIARAGGEARVEVAIDRTARMPVVTGVLPGAAGEVWLTSHLCHPRPGANDNASGAAALLGVAALLADRPRAHAIRFVWGPEFVGVAALLHERATRPRAVVNLDMVGEDPVQCGVPLVVERTPAWVTSPLTPLAVEVVAEVFAQTRGDAGTWRPGPFLGFSDHALFATFADPSQRCPAVQLWHPNDPFNHSAADALDKVSPVQLRRATAIGAVLAELLAGELPRDVLAAIVERWCAREGEAVAPAFADDVRAEGAVLRALVDEGAAAWRPLRAPAGVFAARWAGPFNYRGLLAALPPGTRTEVTALFAADKRNYAVLAHLAVLAETCVDRDAVIAATTAALRAPIDEVAAARLLAALFEARWLEERARG